VQRVELDRARHGRLEQWRLVERSELVERRELVEQWRDEQQ
jgi:hypothetical protein